MKKQISNLLVLIVFSTIYSQSKLENGATMSIGLGMTPAPIIELKYSHSVYANVLNQNASYSVSIILPVFLLENLDTYQVKVGGETTVFSKGNFSVNGNLTMGYNRTKNSNGVFTGLGNEIGLRPLYSVKHWSFGPIFEWRSTYATHIRHSELVKDTFKERYQPNNATSLVVNGPEDGWYHTKSSHLSFGLSLSYSSTNKQMYCIEGGYEIVPNPYNLRLFGDIGLIPYIIRLKLNHKIY